MLSHKPQLKPIYLYATVGGGFCWVRLGLGERHRDYGAVDAIGVQGKTESSVCDGK
jgi:hypothetical protein